MTTMVLPPPAIMPWEMEPTAPPDRLSAAEESMVNSIMKLDAAIAQRERMYRPSIPVRLLFGITNHFRARLSEWFATLLLIQFGAILYGPEEVFPHSPNFAVLASWASEQTWGVICLVVGFAHLFALTINGTFPSFSYSPHVRAFASFLAMFLWCQITLGIWMSGVGGTGLGTYRLVLLLEFWNFIHACSDVGKSKVRRAYHGG